MVLEGSSPTLRMVANRSLRQPSATPQGMFCTSRGSLSDIILPEISNNRFQRPNVGLGGGHRAGDADPFVVREEALPPQPPRSIRRANSAKSLNDNRRMNNGTIPSSP